jgi:Domain of unknown function (DUF5615)
MGLRAREPAIDILDVKTAGLRGMADPTLLEIAAQQDRVLITYDRNTMPRHLLQASSSSPSRRAPSARSSNRCCLCGRHRKPKSGGIRSHICRSGDLAIANPNLMALTGGAVNRGIEHLESKHRVPSWPFQPGLQWKPSIVVSARSSLN